MFNEKKAQQRVSHFLRSLRKRKRYTQMQLANKSHLSLNQIKKYECLNETSSVVRSLAQIHDFAKIGDHSITSFNDYVLGASKEKTEGFGFQDWESILLSKFSLLKLSLRREFVHGMLKKIENSDEINDVVTLVLNCQDLDRSDLSALISLAKHLKSARK